MTDTESNCVKVRTKAEFDAAIASGACIHTTNDADPDVRQWQADHIATTEQAE